MSGTSRPILTAPSAAPSPAPLAPAPQGYLPGVCNIGPWEIRRRRAFAIVGFVTAAALFAGLVAAGAPAVARLLLILPLWGGCFSWLQARRRFCAAYAMLGISNFGNGDRSRLSVDDPAARRADILATARLARDSFLLATVPTIVTVLLPV